MKDVIQRLTDLKQSIHDADTEAFHNGAEHWEVLIQGVIDDLDPVVDLLDEQAVQIRSLEQQVEELEEADDEDFWDDDVKIEVEVNGLPDQLKLEHLQEVFSQYTLDEFEQLIPRR